MRSERIIDGCFFHESLSKAEQDHILNSCLFFLEGVRDLDLIAPNKFLNRMYAELDTEHPIIYLKPSQMALIDQEHPICKKLNQIIATTQSASEKSEAEKKLRRINLFREVIRNSLSALDLGLIRRIDVYQDEETPKREDGSPGLSLRLSYCLTADSCPHSDVAKYAISQALIESYNHLTNKELTKVPVISSITEARVLREPGDHWNIDNIDPSILEIIKKQEGNSLLNIVN